MTTHSSYEILPLGDGAITIDFGNRVDEALNDKVMGLYTYLKQYPLRGVTELVPAFSSLTLYYDVMLVKKKALASPTAFAYLKDQLEQIMETIPEQKAIHARSIRIPVCYEGAMGPDMEALEKHSGLTAEEIVRIHCSRPYRVFMLGFLPGFAYMGPLDARIVIPRKSSPRATAAGSVGIAGWQTGIYPLQSPGGWQIIGRTPLKLFDAKKEEGVLLKAGDRVTFYEITKAKYEEMAAIKLTT